MSNAFSLSLSPYRGWIALLFLAFVYLAFNQVAEAVDNPLAQALRLSPSRPGELSLSGYALLMVVRLVLELLVTAVTCRILDLALLDFPLVGPGMASMTLIGLATGLIVMVCAILAIVAVGSATVGLSTQSPGSALSYALSWLLADLVGATGEELFGRVAILLVAERLFGRRTALIISGTMFSVLHLGNPGASPVWLTRLFFQGVLLAYAVYRTGSMWWSVGYHTSWNWASAPLFGAAGSGYLDEGHLLDFRPTGSNLITGGSVGPEGSIFAFVAVLCALALLVSTTLDRRLAARGVGTVAE